MLVSSNTQTSQKTALRYRVGARVVPYVYSTEVVHMDMDMPCLKPNQSGRGTLVWHQSEVMADADWGRYETVVSVFDGKGRRPSSGLVWFLEYEDAVRSVPTFPSEELEEDVLEGLSENERRRCEEEGVTHLVVAAKQLVTECFDNRVEMRLEYEEDPEEEDHWYSLLLTVMGDRDEIRTRRKEYTRMWLGRVPWPESRKVRLLLNSVAAG